MQQGCGLVEQDRQSPVDLTAAAGGTAGGVAGSIALRRLERPALCPPTQDLAHRLLDGLARVVEQQRVFRGAQGRNEPGFVPLVARLQVRTKVGEISRNSL